MTPHIATARYSEANRRSLLMKTMTMVYFKPKPEYFEQYVEALKKSSPDSYILTRDDEVIEIWLQQSVEKLAEQQLEALDWLDDHRYMLEEYSPEEGTYAPLHGFC
jgi:hypothetical protein